jgi:uncharacterized membrane protein
VLSAIPSPCRDGERRCYFREVVEQQLTKCHIMMAFNRGICFVVAVLTAAIVLNLLSIIEIPMNIITVAAVLVLVVSLIGFVVNLRRPS